MPSIYATDKNKYKTIDIWNIQVTNIKYIDNEITDKHRSVTNNRLNKQTPHDYNTGHRAATTEDESSRVTPKYNFEILKYNSS